MEKKTKTLFSSPATLFSFRNLALVAALALLPGAAEAGTNLRQTLLTELRYDTNARVAVEGPLSGDDFVLLTAPGFEAINQRNTLRLTGIYRPTGYFYFKQSDLNTISHNALVRADYNLSTRTAFMAEERLIYSRESLETTFTGYQHRRTGILTNTVNLSMNSSLTSRTGFVMSASDHILHFDDPVAVDSRDSSASLGLNFQATRETQLNGSYGYSYTSFDLPGGATSNQNTHSLNAGLNTRFRDTLLLTMSGGAIYAITPGDTGGFFDWVARAEVRKSFATNELNLGYVRRTTTSSGLIDQLTLNETVFTELRHTINRNMTAVLYGNFARNHSKPNVTLDAKSYTISASGTWQLYDWLSLGTGYSHFKQESDGFLGEDLQRDHIFINVNMTTYERRF